MSRVRSFYLDGNWYVVVDKYNRIALPQALSIEKEFQYSASITPDNKIYFKKDTDAKFSSGSIRTTLRLVFPKDVRQKIRVEENDVFLLTLAPDGFVLESTGDKMEQ